MSETGLSQKRSSSSSHASTLYKEAAHVDNARERVLRTAYDLFCARGVGAVGIDRIIEAAGVAKMTLYRNFRSKDELVLAVLERREERWTRGWLETEIMRRARTPVPRLLACFDALGDWFATDDYEGCLFINTLVETHDMSMSSPIGADCVARLATVRGIIEQLTRDAAARNASELAHRWQLLMMGAILGASYDRDAAKRAKDLAARLLAQEGLRAG